MSSQIEDIRVRDAGEIIEEIISVCYAYEKRARPPFMGIVQCFDDVLARQLLWIRLAPLVEEVSKSMFLSGFAKFMVGIGPTIMEAVEGVSDERD